MTPFLIYPNNIFSPPFCAKLFYFQLLFNTVARDYFYYCSSNFNNVGIITLNEALMKGQGGAPYVPIPRERRHGTIHCVYYYCAHKKQASMRHALSSRVSFPNHVVAGSLCVTSIKHSQPHSQNGVKHSRAPKSSIPGMNTLTPTDSPNSLLVLG